ncbi:MAG: RNA-binding protein [Oscillospiraceae bacterium]|nr:RNA-binding protein [Oscillospiraceae bacterium]
MEIGDIIISRQGRDKGRIMFIVDNCPDGNDIFVADGRARRIEKPKRKRKKHVWQLACPQVGVSEKLRAGKKVTNSELRKTISSMRQEIEPKTG